MKRFWPIFLFSTLVGCKYFEVDPGAFYRSSQPSADAVKQAAEAGIQTIINLRGAQPGEDWYDEEKKATTEFGITQIDIAMDPLRLPHRDDLLKLLDAFQSAARPILIHCMRGIDRTGEAAALYKMIYMGSSREEALTMLGRDFGYMEEIFPAKKYFVETVWQGEQWAREQYDPCSGQYLYYDPDQYQECTASPPLKLGSHL